jgi:hypothetical protein
VVTNPSVIQGRKANAKKICVQQERVEAGNIPSPVTMPTNGSPSGVANNEANDVARRLAEARELVAQLEEEIVAKKRAEQEPEAGTLMVEELVETLTDAEGQDEEEEAELDESEEEAVTPTTRDDCLACTARHLTCSWTAANQGNGGTCDRCRAAKIRCDVKGKAKKRTVGKHKGTAPVAPDVQGQTSRRSTRLYVGDPLTRAGPGAPKRRSASSETGPSKKVRMTEEWIMDETRELRWECKDMLKEMRRTQTAHGEVLDRHGRVLEALLRCLGDTHED